MRYNEGAVSQGMMERGCLMAAKAKKKYTYLTKAVQMPDGTRKYFRAKTQEELDEKVLKV